MGHRNRFSHLQVLRDDTCRSGALNMAIDQALLEERISGQCPDAPLLRIYGWESPTISFGYFQHFEEVENPEHLPVVRRWTGGGTVQHGHDLTFSLIVPRSCPFSSVPPSETYCIIHAALSESLIKTGVQGVQLSSSAQVNNPGGLTCFNSPVENDLVIGSRKIAGGAQRRSRSGLLHQGSLQGIDPVPRDFVSAFASCLSEACSERGSLTPEEAEKAGRLERERYRTEEWLTRR